MTSKLPGALCDECPLKDRPLVPGYGRPPGESRAVLVGEAPGRNEAREGKPFIGDAGRLLRIVLEQVDIDPNDLYITNVVCCHPPNNKLPPAAIRCCRGRLMQELRQYSPPFCALGATAINSLTRKSDSVASMRGRWYRKGRVLATRHPASLLYQPMNYREFVIDMRKLALGGPQEIAKPDYHIVQSTADLHAMVTKMLHQHQGETLCYDIEASNTTPWSAELLCIGIAYSETEAFIIPKPLCHEDETKRALARLFEPNNGLEFVGHNIKFDMRFLEWQLGIKTRGEHDTMVARHVLDETGYKGLKRLLADYYDVPDYEGRLVKPYVTKKNPDYSRVPPQMLMHYNALDVCYNLRLWHTLKEELVSEGQYHRPYLFPVMAAQRPVIDLELHGMLIDDIGVEEVIDSMESYMLQLHDEMVDLVGYDFNPRSHQQTSKIVYDNFGVAKFAGRNYKPGSVCQDAKERIIAQYSDDSLVVQFLRAHGYYSSMSRILPTYVKPLIDKQAPDGRVHPELDLTGARTGRLAARDPPVHSIPKPKKNDPGQPDWGTMLRGCFVAPDGYVIMSADYSQAELRVAAAFSLDPFLIDLYQRGGDGHDDTARALYSENFTSKERAICKAWNFGQMYGGTIYSFVASSGLNMAKAKAHSTKWQKLVAGFVQWKVDQFNKMRELGYVDTPFNRRRRMPLLTRNNQDDAKKAAVNAPIQSTASDLTLVSLMEVSQWIKDNNLHEAVRPILTVHDSVILEVAIAKVDRVASAVKGIMEQAGEYYCPEVPWVVDVEVGPSWGDLHEWQQVPVVIC